MASYTRLLGVSLIVASTAATLARALERRTAGMPVLIDTAGINPLDPEELDFLPAFAGACEAGIVLVLPAGQDTREAAEQAVAFARAGARWLLPTRLDQTRRLGSILTAAAAGGLALTEAGVSPRATDGLTPLTPAFLAERLMLGPGPLEQAAMNITATLAASAVATRPPIRPRTIAIASGKGGVGKDLASHHPGACAGQSRGGGCCCSMAIWGLRTSTFSLGSRLRSIWAR